MLLNGLSIEQGWMPVGPSYMKVYVSSIFPARPSTIFEDLQNPAILVKVASPIMVYKPVKPETFPPVWETGKAYFVKLYMFGFIPMGTHRIVIEYFDKDAMKGKSDESGTIAKLWSHQMTVKPYNNDATLYTDEIEIKAGIWTFFVWLFASYFYRHRQRKWKALFQV
jgi:hypothetical protein